MMSGYLHRFGFSSLMKNKPELANRGGTAFQLLQMIDCDPFYGEAIRVALHKTIEAGDINRVWRNATALLFCKNPISEEIIKRFTSSPIGHK